MTTEKSASAPSSNYASKIIGEFPVDKSICKVIRVHKPSEPTINTETLLDRGAAIGADMRQIDGELLFRHRWEIPTTAAYSQYVFLFPMWVGGGYKKNSSYIRGIDRKGVDWWCLIRFPDTGYWDQNCVLVRFSDLQLPSTT